MKSLAIWGPLEAPPTLTSGSALHAGQRANGWLLSEPVCVGLEIVVSVPPNHEFPK